MLQILLSKIFYPIFTNLPVHSSSENEDHMYPTLPASSASSNRQSGESFGSAHNHHKPVPASRGQQSHQPGVTGRRASGSIFNLTHPSSGSSPQTSHSSRSATPKTDSSDFDGSV